MFYCASTCLDTEIAEGKVVALKMDDTQYMLGGFGLQPDSEYLSMFNHFLLKAFETGIVTKLSDLFCCSSEWGITQTFHGDGLSVGNKEFK